MTTIKAVAPHAGVSITTVSHTLNHPERVTPELRERVRRAVDALGYEPNPSARTLRTGRTSLLALLLPDLGNPFFPELAHALQGALALAGYAVLISTTDTGDNVGSADVSHLLRQLRPQRFDGALLVSEALRGAEHLLADVAIPAVSIGRLEHPALATVTFDDYAAAYEATAYLLRRGHQRIGHVAGDHASWPGRERRRGYTQALLDHGLPVDPQLIVHGSFQRETGAVGMRALLGYDPPPTAVFIANGLMAIAALGVAVDAGRRVPEELAIVAFDDIAALSDVRPQLTTIAGSPRALGDAAAQLLLQQVEAPQRHSHQLLVLPHSLIQRSSA